MFLFRKTTPDVLVCLQYRDRLSLGENRTRLGFAAFHWSVIIPFSKEYHRFDVTDGIILNTAGEDANPSRNWIYRHQVTTTLTDIPRYLGAVRIGRLGSSTTPDVLQQSFETLPLPRADIEPQENCVSWTRGAVGALEDAELIITFKEFQLENFMEYALRHADERIKDPSSAPEIVDYPAPQQQRDLSRSIFGYIRSLQDRL